MSPNTTADRGIPAAPGTDAPAPPLLAEAWLAAWADIGGGVTISTRSKLHPWRLPERDEHRETATRLLAHLLDTPGLPQAIRVVLTTRIRATLRRRK